MLFFIFLVLFLLRLPPRSQIRKTLGPSRGCKSSGGIHCLHFYTKQWIMHVHRHDGEAPSIFIYPAKAQMLMEANANHLLAPVTSLWRQVMIQVPHVQWNWSRGCGGRSRSLLSAPHLLPVAVTSSWARYPIIILIKKLGPEVHFENWKDENNRSTNQHGCCCASSSARPGSSSRFSVSCCQESPLELSFCVFKKPSRH